MARRIKLKTPILGRRNFLDENEVEFYRRYKKMKLDRRLIYDTHTAVGIVEGYIPARDAKEEIDAWQHLIDTGIVWSLQGWFGRTATELIAAEICKPRNRVVHQYPEK